MTAGYRLRLYLYPETGTAGYQLRQYLVLETMTAGYRLRLSRDKNRRIPGKTVSLYEDRYSRIPGKTLYLFRDRDRRIQVKDCIPPPPIHPHTIRVSVTQVLLFPWNTVIALSLYPAVCSSNGCRIAFRGGGGQPIKYQQR